MRILIAEDDTRLLKSLVHIFESNNYIVDGVSNGEEAYKLNITDNSSRIDKGRKLCYNKSYILFFKR